MNKEQALRAHKRRMFLRSITRWWVLILVGIVLMAVSSHFNAIWMLGASLIFAGVTRLPY